ncbi:MAG: hypothetical protein U1G08_03730 [Verrucomicrobiota bacterium]
MKFSDPQLQRHFDRVFLLTTDLPENLRPICALFDAYYRFRVTDGEQGTRTREVLAKLTPPELRPALRDWYRHPTVGMNPTATAIRHTLSLLVGESL